MRRHGEFYRTLTDDITKLGMHGKFAGSAVRDNLNEGRVRPSILFPEISGVDRHRQE
jgi:hypothetical protein